MVILEENRHAYEALTRYNYFPNQKEDETELPPCFSTSQFTPEIVELLVSLKDDRKQGYDQVEYSISRHNNVPRRLGLIHPKAYAHLAKTISDNYKEIKEKIKSTASMIKPEMHADGRILIMNYEDVSEKINRVSNESFGKRFRVHSDISSCFHTIYSHSIPWAALGFKEAKKALNDKSLQTHWSNRLDANVRMCKRNETLGLPIGPATSSVVVELILANVDAQLDNKGFGYKRYIDDYVCHCETHEKAKDFIRELSSALEKFKLNLNLNKTNIIELPDPNTDEWISRLSSSLSSPYVDANFTRRKYTLSEAQNYLDVAIRLNNETPDGSVLKYAIKTIVPNLADFAIPSILDSALNLCWHFPIILPHIETLLSSNQIDVTNYKEKINAIILENAKNNRSDGMAWGLYYLWKFKLQVSIEAYSLVLKSKDCISILLLYSLKQTEQHIIDFAFDLLCKSDYEKDQYWLLLYQLYIDGKIKKIYKNDDAFELLKTYKVNFLPNKDIKSVTETYCDYISKFSMFGNLDSKTEDPPEAVEFTLWAKDYMAPS